MKAGFVNPFLKATVNVLSTMAMLTPEPGKPNLKMGEVTKGDITGVIGLTGDKEGSLAVSFSTSCALKIVENILGEKHEELNDEVADAVGELTNMISGDARSQLQQMGYAFKAAVPSVIRGKGHTVKHISKGPTLVIPFTTDSGDFFVEASFSE